MAAVRRGLVRIYREAVHLIFWVTVALIAINHYARELGHLLALGW